MPAGFCRVFSQPSGGGASPQKYASTNYALRSLPRQCSDVRHCQKCNESRSTPFWIRRDTMLTGFRQFVLRGNVLDLAVAVVLGAAFGAVITALVKDLLTPLIAAVAGSPDFSGIAVQVNGSKLLVGDFMNAVIAFAMLATVVYFFVVLPVNTLMARLK